MTALQAHRAPVWLRGWGAGDGAFGGNLQTIVSARLSRCEGPFELRWQRQRWTTPDADFIDVDFAAPANVAAAPDVPRLVLFHGLEGHSDSHYARAFATAALERGWAIAVPHFRGCSGELNLAPRAYHSGDFEELAWILERLRSRWSADAAAPAAAGGAPLQAVGISLGGNALLRWAQESGASAASTVRSLAAISAPLDLAAGGHAIAQGFNRWVYNRMFLATMKPKALRKWQQHPGLFDRERLLAARTLHEFDNVFTAPLHGFRDTDDYWARASARPHLNRIRVPALVVNARNDPFVPAASLPLPGELSGSWVQLAQPAHGGHLGFAAGGPPGDMRPFAREVCDWLARPACDLPGDRHG